MKILCLLFNLLEFTIPINESNFTDFFKTHYTFIWTTIKKKLLFFLSVRP